MKKNRKSMTPIPGIPWGRGVCGGRGGRGIPLTGVIDPTGTIQNLISLAVRMK